MQSIPPALQSVLDLFATALADVHFPDVDGLTLAHLATEVEAAAQAVAAAQAALESSRHALEERQDALLQQAQRAVAYARVYAEADEALSARINVIPLSRPARRPRNNEEALVLSTAPPLPRVRSSGRRRSKPVEEPLPAPATMGE